MRSNLTPEERFWSKVEKTEGCWIWVAGLKSDGYAQFSIAGKTVPAHRYSYEIANGGLPTGLVIDHLCRNRGCVRPSHLEAVTQRQNLLRSDTFQARNLAKTECLRGHSFDEANTYVRANGQRRCRACERERAMRVRHSG